MIRDAMKFAIERHGEQTRKYTGQPYWRHCADVAFAVMEKVSDDEMVAAAFLHDVVEDTDTTLKEVRDRFGVRVANLVNELTDKYTKEAYPDLNRAERKRLECERWAGCSEDAKTIKLCDLIDNTSSIVKHDPTFAVAYLREKADLLEAMGY